LVGYDSNQNDYSAIGNTGGLNHVSLKVEELPAHTHTDNGHQHYVSLMTSHAGQHAHTYRYFF
jgi:microcystin-dependent protein